MTSLPPLSIPPPASSSASDSSHSSSHSSTATFRPSDPVHLRDQPSLLSSEASSQNFRGLLNLGAIILIAMNTRLVVENFLKYGFLIRIHSSEAFTTNWDRSLVPLIALATILTVNPLLAYAIERLAFRRSLSSSTANTLHILNCLFVFLVPQITVIRSNSTFLMGMLVEFATLIMTMKLVSFAHVSDDVRTVKREYEMKKKDDSDNNQKKNTEIKNNQKQSMQASSHVKNDSEGPKSPAAVSYRASASAASGPSTAELLSYQPSLSHLLYFLAAPTLVYQLSYPRTPRIRKRFVLRRFIEMIFCISLQLFIIEQYVFPLVRNALVHFESGNLVAIFERVLKLAIPITIHWLLMFYGFFHAYLNLTAELLRFGDRLFYSDWYNSSTLDSYWRKWNLPVHHFVVRHVYFPCLRAGLSSTQSQLVVFLLSAIGHELLVSIPAHLIQFHAFFAMLFQLPLIWFTKVVVRSTKAGWIGNCTFWITFLVFGQPMLVLLYATEYLRSN